MYYWGTDEREYCESPSLVVIPPLAIRTSQRMDSGFNQLVDFFSPHDSTFLINQAVC